MTRALTRTNFHSSRLIRILSDLAVADGVDPGMAFAEKLGQWVDYSDAICLSSALTANTASPPAVSSGMPSGARVGASDAFARIRTTLVGSITRSGSLNVGRTPNEWPSPEPGEPLDVAAAYEPYRRSYLALQREMDLNIRPLRAHMRDVLARASPALKSLAALDAALDGILCDQESKLLSTVPLLLKKRFVHLLKAHQETAAAAMSQAANPALWTQPGGWLVRFCHEFQTVLLAELDVRLQPTVGLMEALNNEMTKQT